MQHGALLTDLGSSLLYMRVINSEVAVPLNILSALLEVCLDQFLFHKEYEDHGQWEKTEHHKSINHSVNCSLRIKGHGKLRLVSTHGFW